MTSFTGRGTTTAAHADTVDGVPGRTTPAGWLS
jgi:hypothetical protein